MSGGLIPVPNGHVAAVVTYLEMTAPREIAIPASPLRLEQWQAFDPARYRALFRRVGGKWLWFSRLAMSDSELTRQAGEVHEAIDAVGRSVGMLELDFSAARQCQIRFLGLVPDLAGQGHGRWLFAETMARSWREGVERVTVHTCSLDHPAALPSYMRAGFTAYSRAFESFPDPRLAGLLPEDVAPQLPLIA